MLFEIGSSAYLVREIVESATGDHPAFLMGQKGEQIKIIDYNEGDHFPYVSGKQHYLFKDDELGNYRQLGKETLVGDGHCSFNEYDGNLMVTDRTEGDHLARSLWLYDLEKDLGIMLSSHSTIRGMWMSGDIRCDFHPRWSSAGKRICYDAIDSATHTHQMHIVEFL